MIEFRAMTIFWATVWVLVFVAFLIWYAINNGNGPRGTGCA